MLSKERILKSAMIERGVKSKNISYVCSMIHAAAPKATMKKRVDDTLRTFTFSPPLYAGKNSREPR